jgi:hypothetical protein
MKRWHYVLLCLICLSLGASFILPAIDKRFDVFNIYGTSNDAQSVGDDIPTPYIWHQATANGGFSYWSVNTTFYRSWLNSTVIWKVEKSTDNVKWTDYKKFEVKKDWNEENLTEKHTVIVSSDADAYYRILTNTKADRQLISYDDLSAKQQGNSYSLSFKVSDTKNYDLIYNWDDYLNSPIASTSSFSKQVKTDIGNKQVFEFSVVSNIKIKSGEQFTLDPTYGLIADATLDKWTYDAATGYVLNCMDALLKINNSNYYVTTASRYADTDYDGDLSTFEVNDDGTFVESLISSWEYDASDGLYAGIIHISGNVYAVYYRDAAAGVMFTTRIWDNNGTLQKTQIATRSYTLPHTSQLLHVTGNIYALIYQEGGGGYDYFLETYNIWANGTISTRIDVVEWDQTSAAAARDWRPQAVMLDTDTIAMVWCESVGSDGWLTTYNISATGDITDTASDVVEFDTTYGKYPFIHHIAGDIYAITYADTDSDGWTKTCTIDDTGAITESPEGTITWVDTLEWANTNTVAFPVMFTVLESTSSYAGVYGITYQDSSADGQVTTMTINETGVISNAVIDTLEFDTTDSIFFAPVVQVNDSVFLIIYTDTGYAGTMVTIDINNHYNVDVLTTGSGNWTVPDGVNRITVLVVGGGGGSGLGTTDQYTNGGGGGAGGLVFVDNVSSIGVVSVVPGNNISYSIGAGGLAATSVNFPGNNGGDTTFGNLTAKGGGGGGSSNNRNGVNGGSGGGGGLATSLVGTGGTGTQTIQSGWSGTYGFGNNGAASVYYGGSNADSGAGGGAGSAANKKVAGAGKSYSTYFSMTFGVSGSFSEGGTAETILPTSGVVNSGNGGDGAFSSDAGAYAGGSGIVLIYYFYVEEEEPSNTAPVITASSENPLNKSTDVGLSLSGNYSHFNITISDVDDATQNMNITWSTNESGSWLTMGTNTSVNNGTYYCTNVSWVNENSKMYWWNVSVNDGAGGWNNETYSFTTAGGGEPQTAWHVLDQSINGSIYNNTGSWKVISNSINGSIYNASTNTWRAISNSINGSIYNTTGAWNVVSNTINGSIYNSSTNTWRVISNTINGSIFNASTNTWKVVSNTINGSIYNSTGAWKVISSSINGSIYNNTGAWKVINNVINGSIYNISTVGWTVISNTINGSIFNNTGAWHIISQSINGSIYNTSILSWYVISSNINGSIYNLSGIWHVISSSINGSIYNSSGTWKALSSSINGSIFNSSASTWHIISSSINGSIFNKTGAWKVISNTINGSIYNNSGTWHVISSNINGSIYNASTTGLIQITNPIPANNSINNLIPITLSITISNDDGNNMNITWWWGNSSANATHYLGSTLNVANGTYSMAIPGASVVSTYYWWRVNVSDYLSNYENESLTFKTSISTGGGATIITGGRDRFVMGLVIGSITFMLLGFILFRRKKRKI